MPGIEKAYVYWYSDKNKMGLSYEKKNHPSYRTRCYRIEFLRVVDTN